jgi:stearoyl-CoA desaturase (delta-9 desaturase)
VRDSWVTALVTLGEGYHNFHHRFPVDYRNGVRGYHFDPTKRVIWSLSKIGLARDLRRMPKEALDRAPRARA